MLDGDVDPQRRDSEEEDEVEFDQGVEAVGDESQAVQPLGALAAVVDAQLGEQPPAKLPAGQQRSQLFGGSKEEREGVFSVEIMKNIKRRRRGTERERERRQSS